MPRTTKKNEKVEQPATSSDENRSKSPDKKRQVKKSDKKEKMERQVSGSFATDFDASLKITPTVDSNKVKSTVEKFISDLIELNVELTEANVKYLRKLNK